MWITKLKSQTHYLLGILRLVAKNLFSTQPPAYPRSGSDTKNLYDNSFTNSKHIAISAVCKILFESMNWIEFIFVLFHSSLNHSQFILIRTVQYADPKMAGPTFIRPSHFWVCILYFDTILFLNNFDDIWRFKQMRWTY